MPKEPKPWREWCFALDLSHNMIGDDGARCLGGVLAQCSMPTDLDLGFNNIGAEGATSLTIGLGRCRSLTRLNLRACAGLQYVTQLKQIGAEGANSLAGMLGQWTLLRSLNLSGNAIGDDGARNLERGLCQSPSIRTRP